MSVNALETERPFRGLKEEVFGKKGPTAKKCGYLCSKNGIFQRKADFKGSL